MTRLNIIKGIHYGDYIQSAENLRCNKAGLDRYQFQVCDQGPPLRKYKSWIVTPETDLSDVPLEILEEMDNQMYYCGEGDDESRDAKFSVTRKHIQRVIEERERRRSPS
jgi:hypothetical protein